MAAAAHVVSEQRPAVCGKKGEGKGAIVGLYTDPPPSSTVICLDELGPVAARSYPGPSWSDGAHRPHFRPAYARYGYRYGYRWAFGALAHRTGQVLIETSAPRDTAAWLPHGSSFSIGWKALLLPATPISSSMACHCIGVATPCCGTGAIPASTSSHCPRPPPGSSWLNLIEGFWKILRQRALAGRDGHSPDEIDRALQAGVADWNACPTPFLWGRSPKPQRHLRRRYIYCI